MQGVTIAVATIGGLLAFFLKPQKALLAYCAVLFLYPQAMSVQMGSIDWTTQRLVIIGLVGNVFVRSKCWAGFRFSLLDLAVVLYYFGEAIAALDNAASEIVLNRQFGGPMFDVILPYVCARMILTRREHLLSFIHGLLIIAAPLAVFAVIESITGKSVYAVFNSYYSFGLQLDPEFRSDMRHGLYRARGSFGIAILLGLFFSALATINMGLWKQRGWSRLRVLFNYALMLSGVVASMSSAPLFSTVIGTGMLSLFRLRKFWIPFTVAMIAAGLFVEIYSNRHFYHVLTLLALNSKTAHYRIYLIEEAFGGGMDGHWLTGYGYVGIGPGTDNSNFFWEHKDFTNVYIAILARFGLMGLLPFLLVNFMFYRKLFVAARMCRDPADLWLIWCIASALVGWNIAFLTVSSFRQVVTLLYIFIAICNNLPDMVRVAALAGAPAPVPEQRPFVGYHRRPWRYNNGRRFSGDRQLERPGIPPQVSQVPPEG